MSNDSTMTIAHEHKDNLGARMGMWAFLVTELLLFFGVFLLYAIYRTKYPSDFAFAGGELNTVLGATNTIILLTSSFTVVLAVAFLERGKRMWSFFSVLLTILLGLGFLVIKYFEWSAKIHHGLYPGSEELMVHTKGENIFYALYYGMTGLHGLHVLIGLIILGFMAYFIGRKPRKTFPINSEEGTGYVLINSRGKQLIRLDEAYPVQKLSVFYEEHPEVNERNLVKLENAALYWHLVDVIWIFLFPLFYLIS